MPYQIIDEMTTARRHLSDMEMLSELAAIPPLADEDDACWRHLNSPVVNLQDIPLSGTHKDHTRNHNP